MSKIIFGPSGGIGGHPFDDTPPLENTELRELRIWSGSCVHAIQCILDQDGENIEHIKHGGSSGNLATMHLAHGEYITEVYGRYGSYIDSLSLRTNQGQIRRFGGQGGHSDFIYSVPQGFAIIGFWGRAGTIIDAIGVHVLKIKLD